MVQHYPASPARATTQSLRRHCRSHSFPPAAVPSQTVQAEMETVLQQQAAIRGVEQQRRQLEAQHHMLSQHNSENRARLVVSGRRAGARSRRVCHWRDTFLRHAWSF